MLDQTLGDLDVQLFNSSMTIVGQSRHLTEQDFEQILRSPALRGTSGGPYSYVDVSGHNNATNSEYDLVLETPDTALPGQHLRARTPSTPSRKAANLQTIDGVQTFSGLSIGATASTSENWFSFNLVSGLTGLQGQSVSISFDDAQGNLTLSLYNSSILTNSKATPLGTSSVSGDQQTVSLAGLTAAGGPYYIEVSGEPNPNFTLTINAPQSLEPDWAESHLGFQSNAWVSLANNSSQATAYDLRDLSSEIVHVRVVDRPARERPISSKFTTSGCRRAGPVHRARYQQ